MFKYKNVDKNTQKTLGFEFYKNECVFEVLHSCYDERVFISLFIYKSNCFDDFRIQCSLYILSNNRCYHEKDPWDGEPDECDKLNERSDGLDLCVLTFDTIKYNDITLDCTYEILEGSDEIDENILTMAITSNLNFRLRGIGSAVLNSHQCDKINCEHSIKIDLTEIFSDFAKKWNNSYILHMLSMRIDKNFFDTSFIFKN